MPAPLFIPREDPKQNIPIVVTIQEQLYVGTWIPGGTHGILIGIGGSEYTDHIYKLVDGSFIRHDTDAIILPNFYWYYASEDRNEQLHDLITREERRRRHNLAPMNVSGLTRRMSEDVAQHISKFGGKRTKRRKNKRPYKNI